MSQNYQTLYDRAAEIDYEMADRWQDWFDPDIPDEEAWPWDDAEVLALDDIAVKMLEAGETYWSHPGWIRDVWRSLEDWALSGSLIRVRLTAEWLLSTAPQQWLDDEMGDRLRGLVRGEFCEVFCGMSNPFPAMPEQYLKMLKWGAVWAACDALHEAGISPRSGFPAHHQFQQDG